MAVPFVRKVLESRYEIHYEGKFPEKGPCLIFSKHLGDMDQFFIGMMLYEQHRLATYIMRDFGFINYFLRPMGGIMVVRSKELAKGNYTRAEAYEKNKRAADYSISRLKLEEPVVNFPEATRSPGKLRTPFKLWVAERILQAQENGEFGCQIQNVSVGLECQVSNGYTHIWVRVGEPFYVRSKNELEEKLQKEIPRLSNIQP